MLLEPSTLESSPSRVLASAMREDMFVKEGMRRANLRSRSTEKAHLAVQMSVYKMGDIEAMERTHPKQNPFHNGMWQDTELGLR